MNYITGLLSGIASVLTLTSPPLYRYPYRNTAEAFRGDWKNIGKDIEATQQNFDGMRGEVRYE